jgi:hypothetical protein
MAIEKTFEPRYTAGQTVTPNTTSSSVTLGFSSETICFSNLGATVVYIRVGVDGIAASTADYPVLPSSQITVSKALDETTVAFISPGGAGTLHIIPGVGY